MSVTISIITVVYNGSKYLEATINSVIKQKSNDFEYIIVDGGSTDGTVELIVKNEKHISQWVSEPDNGLYDAMNKGLKMASGDFVWFINAGDEINDANTLKLILKKASEQNADLLYGEAMIIGEGGSEIGMRRKSAPEKLNWKSFKRGMVVCHQSFIPKRAIAPLYDLKYKYSSDIDWEIKCLKKAKSIVNTKLVLSRFLDNGQSKRTIIPSIKERFRIMVKYYGLLSSVLNHIPIILRFFVFYFRHGRF
jgi:glycosyltransferase involved in cell wall biosynthesis